MREIPAWRYTGRKRPVFAETPGPGQESVWDYPRPPVLVPDSRRVRVLFNEHLIAESSESFRILETAGAPTFYLPTSAVDTKLLSPYAGSSWCEWKGDARYWQLNLDPLNKLPVAWDYPNPNDAFTAIKNYFSFYPSRVECFVDDERVRPQPGGFYGGWVTDEIAGPIKGEPGSEAW